MATKTRKLGIMPTLVVLLMAFGLAFLVGVILVMMLVRTGIEHSPEQSKLGAGWTISSSIARPTGSIISCYPELK
jgi:hypothetical protein